MLVRAALLLRRSAAAVLSSRTMSAAAPASPAVAAAAASPVAAAAAAVASNATLEVRADGVAVVRLDSQGERVNTLSAKMIADLTPLLARMESDAAVRAAVARQIVALLARVRASGVIAFECTLVGVRAPVTHQVVVGGGGECARRPVALRASERVMEREKRCN